MVKFSYFINTLKLPFKKNNKEDKKYYLKFTENVKN